MSTRIIGRVQAEALPRIAWSNSEPGLGIPQPFVHASPPKVLNDIVNENDSQRYDLPGIEAPQLNPVISEIQLASARHDGYEKGLREGERTGFEKAEQASKLVFDQMAASIAEFATLRRRIRQEAEQDIVKLSLAVAKKIIHRELSIDPHALSGVVKAALEQIEIREVRSIRMHPLEVDILRGPLLSAGLPTSIEIIADSSLEKGAIRLDTVRGEIDAGVGTQLQEIERGFADRLEGK
jgi:flagellar biosynthesis/type III secretory pathway protein FliH